MCKMKKWISLIAFFLTSSLMGENRFFAEGQWLYFRPSVDTSLVNTTTDIAPITTINKTADVIPSYTSGWRAAMGYQFCDQALFIRWTQLRTKDTRDFSGNSIATSAGSIPGVGNAIKKFSDYAFEGLYKSNCFYINHLRIDFLGGIQYAWVGVQDQIFVINPATPTDVLTVKQVGHFWGVGPELGLDLAFFFTPRFSFVGRGLASLLVGRFHESLKFTNFLPINAIAIIEPRWRITPALDFRAGLKYERGCFFIEGGYEIISYVRGLRLLNLSATTNAFEASNADMQGPYLTLGFSF